MQQPPLSKIKIESKLAIIREALTELQALATTKNRADFLADKVAFGFAEHHLRRALEAIFDISGHIVSRFPYAPGKRPKEYKELALALGTQGIIDISFAKETLVKMAGYRNRLVHLYYEITKEELFDVITHHLNDIEFFCAEIVKLITDPARAHLTIEE